MIELAVPVLGVVRPTGRMGRPAIARDLEAVVE